MPDARSSLWSLASMGTEFAAVIVGGGALGWWLDKKMGSSPLFLIVLVFLGFAAEMVRFWKAAQESSKP